MVHSLLSPSSAKRWIACNPSLDAPEGKDSIYSAEGGLAHEIADTYLQTGQLPKVGTQMHMDGFPFVVTQSMLDNVAVYTGYVEGLSLIYDVRVTESRIVHSKIKDFGGTIDCCFVGPGVHIVDLKYGAGVMVDVEENEQLGCYALLTLDHIGLPIQDVQATVVQPRSHEGREPIQETTLTKAWLLDLWNRINRVIAMPSKEYVSGEHCQFCSLKPHCPKLHELTLVTAKNEFQAIAEHVFDEDEGEAETENVQRALWVLENASAIEAYISGVKKWAYEYAISGKELTGYKLVETFTNRVYAVGPEKILSEVRKMGLGIGKKHIYKSVLLSPAQLEKKVGRKLVDQFCKRMSKGVALVLDSDNRPRVEVTTAVKEFSSISLDDEDFENGQNED